MEDPMRLMRRSIVTILALYLAKGIGAYVSDRLPSTDRVVLGSR